jgi:hypothetical protein
MDVHVAAADSWLFRPQTTYRVRPGSDEGTPVPMDEALAANPPDGAVLDYYIKEKSALPVQLEILDSEGKLVRRFASDEKLSKTKPDDVPFQYDWVSNPQPLLADAGMHRFVWDLHYALPKGVRSSFFGPSGPWAVPGNYIVKLTMGGKSSTQPLTIKLDPRIKTPQDALVRQFDLASKLAGRLGEVSTALQQVSELRKQIEERKKELIGNAEMSKALQGLAEKMEAAVEPDSDDDFMLFGLAVPGKEHEALPKVAAALTGLMIIVESADTAPTTDAAIASERWEEAAVETLTRWTAFQKEELANVNALLEKAKLKKLIVEESLTRR